MNIFRFLVLLVALYNVCNVNAQDLRIFDGVVNRLVVFARFFDDPDFEETKNYYQNFYNGDDFSVKSYFSLISGQKMTVNSVIYPSDSQLSYELKYCSFCYDVNMSKNFPDCKGKDISAGLQDVSIGFVIKELIDKIGEVDNVDIFDKNNDGYIDDFVIVLSGGSRGIENSIFHPHTGKISDRFIDVNGEINIGSKKISKYTIVYERTSMSTQCRFFLNNLGFPFLYRKNSNNPRPVGPWDIMDGPEMSIPLVYNRYKYSNKTWIDNIPVLESNGEYILYPSETNTNNAYKILTSNPNEFFIVEYRSGESPYDYFISEGGLIFYLVNSDKTGSIDEIPEYYIFRKDGTINESGEISDAVFSDSNGRDSFSKSSNPYPFTMDGLLSDINIYDIRNEGDYISFKTGALPSALENIHNDDVEIIFDHENKKLNISGDWNSLCIVDASGMSVLNKSPKSDLENIDLNFLPSGAYIVSVISENKNELLKIFIK